VRLVLASTSPRRSQLLERLGLDFDSEPPDVDESRVPDEQAASYVERVARLKATSVVSPGKVVVAADTAVVHEGRILGKPAHPEEARSMLRRLEGDRHEVFTGVAVASAEQSLEVVSVVDVTEVALLSMTAEEIASYVDSGEPMDKAGAYALQEKGGRFVERVVGSPFTVIGLPVHLLPRLLRRVGADFDEFIRTNGGGD
jgi:septum formation protein